MNHRHPTATHSFLAFVLLALVAVVGCFRNSNTASRPEKSPDQEVSDVPQDDENEAAQPSDTETPDEVAAGETEQGEATIHEEGTEGPSETETAATADQENANPTESAGGNLGLSETDVEETDESDTLSLERVLLLTTGGPLVIDVRIGINGESHDAALERLVEEAMSAADEDGDGVPSWDEVANSKRFQYGQFGNLEIDSDSDREQLIRLYDADRDKVVDREELPRFLTRNVGRSQSFSLRSSNEYRGDNRSRSPIRRLLDRDRNGAISKEELAQSRSRLLQFDANDDEILTPAEIDDDAAQMERQLSNQRRVREPVTAIHVADNTNWGKVQDTLSELYAYDSLVGPDDWPTKTALFDSLDEDEDKQLSQEELKGFVTVPPHLTVTVAFGDTESEEASEPRIELGGTASEIEAEILAIHEHRQRISIELGDTEIQLFVNEDGALNGSRDQATNRFAMLDEDKNGYLDDEEFPDTSPFGGTPFDGIDNDKDEKIFLEELVSFLDLRQAAFRGQVRARAADDRDAAFTALDTDGDGRLNSREIYSIPERLTAFDRNQDGRVQSHEIPGSMVIGFIRGNPQADAGLFVIPGTERRGNDETTPTWFQGMDANSDGEVSSREFIGEAHHFRQFDADGDGFIDATEASSDSSL